MGFTIPNPNRVLGPRKPDAGAASPSAVGKVGHFAPPKPAKIGY
jgi:hypothetical protein